MRSVGHVRVPESELGVLGDVSGKDVIELGCGTAYFGAWLARRGARRDRRRSHSGAARDGAPMQRGAGDSDGVDRGERGGGAASGRVVRPGVLGVRRVDLVRSVQVDSGGGAASSSRRRARLPAELDALRAVLARRPDGKVGEQLLRPQFGMHRMEWSGEDEGIDFQLPHGDWIRVLRASGFEIEGLWELQAPRERRDAQLLRLRVGRVGAEVAGRGDLEGPQARVSVPPAPPIVLASESPQRRAILEQLGHSVRRRAAPVTRSDRAAIPVELAAGKARSVGGGRGARARRRHGGDRRRRGARQARRMRLWPRRCSSGCRAGRTRSSRASACGLPAWEELTARRRGHVPCADRA